MIFLAILNAFIFLGICALAVVAWTLRIFFIVALYTTVALTAGVLWVVGKLSARRRARRFTASREDALRERYGTLDNPRPAGPRDWSPRD